MRLPDRYCTRLAKLDRAILEVAKHTSMWVCSACFYMLISEDDVDAARANTTGSPHTLALPLG